MTEIGEGVSIDLGKTPDTHQLLVEFHQRNVGGGWASFKSGDAFAIVALG